MRVSFHHQLHHVVVGGFDTPTRMQQMSNKYSKKTLFQDVIQQTIASPSGGYWKQYDRAVSSV